MTASEDLTARVWDLESRSVSHVLPHGSGDDEWVESARFSRDGQHVLTAGDDGTARSSGAPPQGHRSQLSGKSRGTGSVRRCALAGRPLVGHRRASLRRSSSGGCAAEAGSAAWPLLQGRRRGVCSRRRPSCGSWRRHAPRLARRRWGAGRVRLDRRAAVRAHEHCVRSSRTASPSAARAARSGSGIGATGSVWHAWRATATPSPTSRSTLEVATSSRCSRTGGRRSVWSVPTGAAGDDAAHAGPSSLEGAASPRAADGSRSRGPADGSSCSTARSAARCLRSSASRRNGSRHRFGRAEPNAFASCD